MKYIKLTLESTSIKILKVYTSNYIKILKSFYVKFCGPVHLPKKIKKFDIPRSPHVDKDSRDQFEFRKYKKIFYIKKCSKKVFFKLMNYSIPTCINVKLS